MQKIINGKLYDTENPDLELICDWDNHFEPDEPYFFRCKLYRTDNGKYLFYSYGGPKSPYGKGTGLGENMELIPRQKARNLVNFRLPKQILKEKFRAVK